MQTVSCHQSRDSQGTASHLADINPEQQAASEVAPPIIALLCIGDRQAYILSGSSLQEVNWLKSEFSSWFVDKTIISDGGLYLLTAVDPLLPAIPFLEEARNATLDSEGVFQSKDQLFSQNWAVTAEAANALQDAAEPSLPLICDCKTVGEETYFRLSNAKLKAWLKCKVQRIADALSREGSQYSSMDPISLQRYAIGLLGEYLSNRHLQMLLDSYSLSPTDAVVQPEIQPSSDVQVSVTSKGPAKKLRGDPKDIAKQRAKEARDEKREQQMRRESAGMKKMSSFFAPKPQKAQQLS